MNKEEVREIKKEDKKALGKFTIIMILAMIAGVFFGGFSNAMRETIAEGIATGIMDVLTLISPYINLVLTTIFLITVVVLYKKSRRIFTAWDGESEEDINRIETNLSYALWITSANIIVTYFFFAVGFATVSGEDLDTDIFFIRSGCNLLGLIYSMVVTLRSQQKVVNLEKEINPEKRGSIFDTKFAQKWEESCDEAEKLTIYKSAYKSYRVANMTCIGLWLFCVLGNLVWDFGLMPVAIVSLIWLVQTSSYCMESIRLAKHPELVRK